MGTHIWLFLFYMTRTYPFCGEERKKKGTHTKKKGSRCRVSVRHPKCFRGRQPRVFFFFCAIRNLFPPFFVETYFFSWAIFQMNFVLLFSRKKRGRPIWQSFFVRPYYVFFFFTSIVIKRHDSFPGKHQINKFGRLGAPHERWRAHTQKASS